MEGRPRYRVPDELRETLLDFTIAYLLERPSNLAEFGLQFFQRLSERDGGRRTSAQSQQSQNSAGGALNGRDEEVEGNNDDDVDTSATAATARIVALEHNHP